MIDRDEILGYVKEKYDVDPEYPWARTPRYAILRHNSNNKWFCAIINITKNKLGLDGYDEIDVLNLKCSPKLVSLMLQEPGILPAWHMNKEHWITVLLDESIPKQGVCRLIDISYDITL